MLSHVYILVFADREYIKIGKADSIQNRVSVLQKHWGAIDQSNSWQIELDGGNVFQLEKTLHSMLQTFKYPPVSTEDGYTELFYKDALNSAMKVIELYTALGNECIITKGILLTENKIPPKKKIPCTKHNNGNRVNAKYLLKLTALLNIDLSNITASTEITFINSSQLQSAVSKLMQRTLLKPHGNLVEYCSLLDAITKNEAPEGEMITCSINFKPSLRCKYGNLKNLLESIAN